jgi:hypothetical protein
MSEMYRIKEFGPVEAAWVALGGGHYVAVGLEGRAHLLPADVFGLLFEPVPEVVPPELERPTEEERIYACARGGGKLVAGLVQSVLTAKVRVAKAPPRPGKRKGPPAGKAGRKTLDELEHYPIGLRDPRSDKKRLIWDLLKKRPMTSTELEEGLGDEMLDGTGQALWSMRRAGLIEQPDGVGTAFRVAEGL